MRKIKLGFFLQQVVFGLQGEFCNPFFYIWTDSEGLSCSDYLIKKYCTRKGVYGAGWDLNRGSFFDYENEGYTAFNCPQCGCTNNIESEFVFRRNADGETTEAPVTEATEAKTNEPPKTITAAGYDECKALTHECDPDATCTDTDDHYECKCNEGFYGSGEWCEKLVNECEDGTHTCDENAKCTDTDDEFTCECNKGFNGDGKKCKENWKTWGFWGKCGVECGNGSQTRTRECSDAGECIGEATKSRICEQDPCTFDNAVEMKITVSATYTAELADTNSEAFKNLAAKVEDPINQSLAANNIAGSAKVTSFTKKERRRRSEDAGVDANVEVSFVQSAATFENIQKATQEAVDNSPGMSGTLEVTKEPEKPDPCETAECGVNTDCTVEDDAAVCICKSGFVEINNVCEKENVCGETSCDANALCSVVQNVITCTCKENYKKDANDKCNAFVSEWTEWGTCTKTCETGEQDRTRTCSVEGECTEELKETQKCNEQECPPTPAVWADWGEWTKCPESCGGTQKRTRTCEGDLCDKDSEDETKDCPKCDPCKTTDCGANTDCTVEDDTAVCTCKSGFVVAINDVCEKENVCAENSCPKLKDCSVVQNVITCACKENYKLGEDKECKAFVSEWGRWGKCSKECGAGEQDRTRTCSVEGECTEKLTETQKCNEQECPKWLEWGRWAACSVTCGEGTQKRSRKCSIDDQCQGKIEGNKDETKPCEKEPCKESPFKRGKEPLTFPAAKAYCKSLPVPMELPVPKSEFENSLYAEFGETWLDVLINPILERGLNPNQFAKFEKRQRGYLEKDGKWLIHHATEVLPFFCVPKTKSESCADLFTDGTKFEGDLWSIREKGKLTYTPIADADLSDIALGTKLRYSCAGRRSRTGFICVKIDDRNEAFVKCGTHHCRTFTRKKYDFETFLNYVSTFDNC